MDIKAFVSLDVIPIDFLVENQVETLVGSHPIFDTHSTLGGSCYQGYSEHCILTLKSCSILSP
jgi:hypothetical protein